MSPRAGRAGRPRRRPYAPDHWCSRVYLRLLPEHIGLLRFHLEAGGHLGLMTVVDRQAAVIRLNHPASLSREIGDFLDALANDIPELAILWRAPPEPPDIAARSGPW